MMRQKRWFPILYMFAATAFFSSIVIGISQLTRERIQANQARQFELAVLAVIPGLFDETADDLELHNIYVEKIHPPDTSSAGAYVYKKQGDAEGYALPISGRGFWAPIKGVIGIEADKKTLTGIVFYEQNETPGLGAEITTKKFCDQFKGRIISMTGKPINFKRSTESLAQSDIHAITGATQTSVRLEKFLNEGLDKWRTEILDGEDTK